MTWTPRLTCGFRKFSSPNYQKFLKKYRSTKVVELGDVDPRDFVLAQNKARRHVTQAQLAMATTAVYAWKPVGSNQHANRVGTECPPKSNAELRELVAEVRKIIK